ncbi:HEAT repeat domain-containing protein [Synechococcus sp. RS9916]|uniref:HEAT repeat domain-containing protein n=1 Tax=Synechococcus sp. RS9916 TaxID=221359 RepID=UPI0000E54842|nr:HEAT repeat domain-containing protein [Synechococcus sp. RS9916]EAU72898.1 PBS lyase HEAT-like repeat [Synechococcus sp. RS9916]
MTELSGNAPTLEVGELTEDEAYQLAEALKLQLADQQLPSSDEASIKKMVAGLGDQRGALRLTFAQSLGSVGKAAIPILCVALKSNPNVVIRRASAKTLNIIGSELALPNLIEAFETDNDPVVQGSSAGAMATIGIPAIESLLKILSNDKCTAFQVGLINLALSFIGAKAPDAFTTAAKSENPEIRIAALTALSEQVHSSASKTAKNILLEALKDEEAEVRAEAATITGKALEPEEAEAELIALLIDSSPQVRKNTALALMKMESFNSIEALTASIKGETDKQVKNVMKVALNQLEINS